MTPGGAPMLTRIRHRQALVNVVDTLKRIAQLEAQPELALIAEDVRAAMQSIGRITGKVGVEDVLDQIFSAFCIGK
jgi:tRNA modification GTPase